MRILFVCSANVWGGNEKWTSMAMKELSKNHEVHLCYKNDRLADKFGRAISKFRAPFRSYVDFLTYYRLFRFIKHKQIDLIVSTKKKEYFICGILARLLNRKNVLRLGIVRDMDKPLWHNIVYSKLNHGIVVNAHRIKENLLKYDFMNPDKIRVIYNGIRGGGERRRPSDDAHFVISSVGRLTKVKGFHVLIEAVAQLPNEMKDKVRIKIIGSGEYEGELRALSKRTGLDNNVAFLGFQEKPQKIYGDSDLFALISFNEGVSNALLEAMILGVPVLTTKVGGTSEFIEDGKHGFLIDSHNPEHVAIVLHDIIKKRAALPVIGEEGRKKVNKIFSMDSMRINLENFLQEVLFDKSE